MCLGAVILETLDEDELGWVSGVNIPVEENIAFFCTGGCGVPSDVIEEGLRIRGGLRI